MDSLFRFIIFYILGWKIKGNIPTLKKLIFIIYPHTSNYDFFIGLGLRKKIGLKHIKFLGKSELFNPVTGWIFKKLGGIPVNRHSSSNMIDQVVEMLHNYDEIQITISPEGTRKYTNFWRTGFYYIAQKSELPLVLVGFDYSTRTVIFDEPYYVTDDKEKDLNYFRSFYTNINGFTPENQSEIQFIEKD